MDSSPSSLPTPVSRYNAYRRQLRVEIADLLQGSRILERRIGNFDPPDDLVHLGHTFLHTIKSLILAAKVRIDQVPNELFKYIPRIRESEAQLSRFNPKPTVKATRHKRRISEHWKNEDWSSEYLFPPFPPITLRDHHTLSKIESLASVTAAQERGQYSGYPFIVKQAIRRAVLERIRDHDSRDRRQKRSEDYNLLQDVRRALDLVEGWREMNPEEKLR